MKVISDAMKSDRFILFLKRVVVALWSFTLGFCGAAMLLWLLETNGISANTNRGDNWISIVLALGLDLLKFGFCVVVGMVVAAISIFFRPTVFLRSYWLICGAVALLVGVLLLIYGPNLLSKFIAGPLAVFVGGYMTWVGAAGSSSDVEDPPIF